MVTSTLSKYSSSSVMSVFVKDSASKESISAAVAQWSCNAVYYIARGGVWSYHNACMMGCDSHEDVDSGDDDDDDDST